METNIGNCFKLVLDQLKKDGFLLESDPKLPSVCTLITGEALRGSWWSHPQAQTIFQVNEQLEAQQDVLITKLISGKVTFVHRKVWPQLLAVGSARAEWQLKGLSADARALLVMIDAKGVLRTDKVSWPQSRKTKPGDAARELEKNLLVVASQVHTESGAHAKTLETWQHWVKRSGFSRTKISVKGAMKNLEDQLGKLNQQFGAKARLPWT